MRSETPTQEPYRRSITAFFFHVFGEMPTLTDHPRRWRHNCARGTGLRPGMRQIGASARATGYLVHARLRRRCTVRSPIPNRLAARERFPFSSATAASMMSSTVSESRRSSDTSIVWVRDACSAPFSAARSGVGRSSTRAALPPRKTHSCSTTFLSSRMFPGQEYARSAAIVARLMPGAGTWCLTVNSATS